MPTILQIISSDIKEAMKSKDDMKLQTLRMLKSAVKNTEINLKKDALSDQEIMGVINKQIKQRNESAKAYKDGNRIDLAKKEEEEAAVLSVYLPKQMDNIALEKQIKEIIAKNGISQKKEFGKAMRIAQEALQGQADNKRISGVLNKLLS